MLTRLSRRIFNALSEFSYVVKMMSSIFLDVQFFRLSNTKQTGTTCGLPSLLTVVSFAVKVPCMRNFLFRFRTYMSL
jgi:hypothetical protein